MTYLVTDSGFGPDDLGQIFTPLADLSDKTTAVDVPSDTDLDQVLLDFATLTAIRIDFPSFSDGRGFTLARLLRLRGFTGRLRAKGHVISDQYAMARRSGFDEVEIEQELAARQPETEWVFRANWQNHDYQSRVRKSA
jgi:uncharacterized protein (DUF934 family)